MEPHILDMEQSELKEWQTPELKEFDINEMTRNQGCPGSDGCGAYTHS